MTRLIAFTLALAAASLVGPSVAFADEVDDAMTAGEEALRAGRFAEAEAAYERAFAIRPSPDVAANLAQAEIGQKKNVEAAEHMSYAIRLIPATTKPETRQAMQGLMSELASKLGALTIEVNVAGAELLVGTRRIGTSPLADRVFVEPGDVSVKASIEGYEPIESKLKIATGGSETVKLLLKKKTEAVQEGRPSWPGWLMGGVGIAAAGAGVGTFVAGSIERGDADDIAAAINDAGGSCEPASGPGSEQCAAGLEAADAVAPLETSGVVLMSVGGALLVAGIIYLVLPDNTSKPPVAIAPWFTADGGGAVVGASF